MFFKPRASLVLQSALACICEIPARGLHHEDGFFFFFSLSLSPKGGQKGADGNSSGFKFTVFTKTRFALDLRSGGQVGCGSC